jgi:hypothetical protein
VFHTGVAEVDRDVAYVGMVLHKLQESVSNVLSVFQTYVASVFIRCCIYFRIYVASVLSVCCVYLQWFQVFFCKCFIRMFQVFHLSFLFVVSEYFKSRSDVAHRIRVGC